MLSATPATKRMSLYGESLRLLAQKNDLIFAQLFQRIHENLQVMQSQGSRQACLLSPLIHLAITSMFIEESNRVDLRPQANLPW
jgi:hypothetical protein